jgi:SAM-dependent methyltransferase
MCTCENKCHVTQTQFEYKNVAYYAITCEICGFIKTKPVTAIKIDIYETGHYKVRAMFLIPFLINLPDYIFIYLCILKYKITKDKNVLDFGCGKGYFLYFLKKLGYRKIFGVETSISRAAFSRELTGMEISSDIYTGGQIMQSRFDFISLIHVLEHIENPFDFLDIFIDQAIEIDGVVFIEVPNVDSFASKIASKTWAHFTPHFHVNHFTPRSFMNYCSTKGYKYDFVGTFSFYNSAMGMSSAIFSFFGYRGSIFEDMKNKKLGVILPFILLLPVTIILEMLISLFFKKGSVIKFSIRK